jgi:hypothetical protein
MGTYLDLLLGAVVQDDGVEFPHRRAINFVGFLVSDDEANDRIRVASTGEGGALVLLGDVNGSPDNNRITSISGDAEDTTVSMFATRLHWDPDASAGVPEISISTALGENGALQIMHAGKRALLASGTAPELGNTTAINRMIGGVRLTTRAISSHITLDTTTKDSIAWISAALERQVTLPPASAGRVLLLPFVGATTPVLKRAGSELINGVAGNYSMTGDAQGGLGIAVSDGTNWVARTMRNLAGLGGDVNGDIEANYITQISGAGGEVLITASNLIFGGAELTVSPGEQALQVAHEGERVLYAHSVAPEFGTYYGLTKLIGGLRLTVRAIDNGTIDELGNTDAIGWLDATSEGSGVVLPAATPGRFLLLPFIGDNPQTLYRTGSELINGVASDYEMEGDAAGGFGIAVSDGTNWVARVIRAPSALPDLIGDANGPLDGNYITTITGPGGGGGSVSVLAQELNFSGTATIEMPSESDGALELRHLGTRVVLVHAGGGSFSGPEFGATAGISMLRGGLRLATKTTAVDVTLDAATKESVVHVDASVAARNVTLPEAMGDGRIYIFIIKGSNTVTIKRFTGNTINGVAADYIVPLPNSCAIASCGSGGWFVRSFADSMGVTMGPGPGSATGSLSKTFGFSYAANANANFDLTIATYAGLKTAIDAGKVVMVKAMTQCWYNWAPGSIAILATATSTVSPTLQGAPLFDGSESPEKVPPGSTFLNILGGPVAGILTVYLAE